ncbi:hypothetical protein AB5I41_29180 [Sphingomonas sp. MMS24-JH45]
MIAPKMVEPICPPNPQNPPDEPMIELIADWVSWSEALFLVIVSVRVPSGAVVTVRDDPSVCAPTAPAIWRMLGAELLEGGGGEGTTRQVAEQELRAEAIDRRIRHLGHDRLDHHLLAALVELDDDLGQLALDVGRRGDDDRVGAGEARDDHGGAPARAGNRRLLRRCARIAGGRRRHRLLRREPAGRARPTRPELLLLVLLTPVLVSVCSWIASGAWPTSCWSTGSSCAASSAFSRKTTLISLALRARWSRSRASVASRATVPGSPRSATAFELSIATAEAPTDPACRAALPADQPRQRGGDLGRAGVAEGE